MRRDLRTARCNIISVLAAAVTGVHHGLITADRGAPHGERVVPRFQERSNYLAVTRREGVGDSWKIVRNGALGKARSGVRQSDLDRPTHTHDLRTKAAVCAMRIRALKPLCMRKRLRILLRMRRPPQNAWKASRIE